METISLDDLRQMTTKEVNSTTIPTWVKYAAITTLALIIVLIIYAYHKNKGKEDTLIENQRLSDENTKSKETEKQLRTLLGKYDTRFAQFKPNS